MGKFESIPALLRRAAAALETPGDLTPDDVEHLIEDLLDAADFMDPVT